MYVMYVRVYMYVHIHVCIYIYTTTCTTLTTIILLQLLPLIPVIYVVHVYRTRVYYCTYKCLILLISNLQLRVILNPFYCHLYRLIHQLPLHLIFQLLLLTREIR